MKITEITGAEFRTRFLKASHAFNTVEFAELNRQKASALHYLLLSDTRTRGGIILGERDSMLLSPFSAPYGWLSVQREPSIGKLDDIHQSLVSYAAERGCGLRMTLPPIWHNPSFIQKGIHSLGRIGGSTMRFELSHHMILRSDDEMMAAMGINARTALRRACENDLTFTPLELTDSNVARCYGVICDNHAERGFPVRMTLHDLQATARIMNAGLFVVSRDTTDVAAAILYEVMPGVNQVIYWGDIPAFHHLHPMNLLAFRVAAFCRDRGSEILDIGPSTEDGSPNYGLCDFKESLGCKSSLKAVWEYR